MAGFHLAKTAIFCMQALQQMHKILGQVDIVGVPFTLGCSLFEGVNSLVVAPTKAKSPEEFFDSLGRGFFILFRNAAYGIMHALGQVHILHDAITYRVKSTETALAAYAFLMSHVRCASRQCR